MELAEIKKVNPEWLSIGGEADPDLAARLHRNVSQLVADGQFSWDEAAYVSRVSMLAGSGNLTVSEKQLEKIRRACQVWDVDLNFKEISSHRKLVGPLIVASKRLLYPILKAFLKDFVRQQRSYNAAVLALIVDLYSEQSNKSDKPEKN